MDPTGKGSGIDISWTAAFPLLAGWLHRYYGETAEVRAHYPAIKMYLDAQLSSAKLDNRPGDLPDFWTWGDWCAVEARAECTPGTGANAAAANFLLAIDSFAGVATALGESADAKRWAAAHDELVKVYDTRFWNATMQTWANDPMEVQTLTSIALGAGVGSPAHRAAALKALVANVNSFDDHLTVGR